MLKKFISILFLFSALFVMGFAAGNNENYTNLYLNANGWCAGLNINFKLYNQTDWNNKNNIEDNLCGVNQTPTDDNCLDFNKISNAKVVVYNGPLDGLKVLFNGTSDVNGTFNMKFNSANAYLIKIIPSGNYNNFETKFQVDKCVLSKDVVAKIEENKTINETINETINKIYNQSFDFPVGKIILKNTKSNLSSDFSLKLVDLKNNEINELNNTIKSFEITGIENFDSLNVDVPIDNVSNLKLFLYDTNFNKWNEVNNFKIKNSTLSIESAKFGIYSVVNDKPKKVEVSVVEKTNNTDKIKVENSTGSHTLLYSILGVLVILTIAGFVYINSNKDKKDYHNDKLSNNSNNKTSDKKQEVLTNYSDVYSKTKAYVQQYKKSFSKDQVYRALKQNNIPIDIIDKVFIEEF